MRVVIQRVGKASVRVDGELVGSISKGLLVFLGITHDDQLEDVSWLVKKTLGLRIFSDTNDVMNFSEIGRAHVRTPVTEKSRMPSSA